MTTNLEETLISVWRQTLVEDRKTVTLEDVHYPVRTTSRSKLREVDFRFEEQMLRGLEQNPNTNSRWAQLAREGKKVSPDAPASLHRRPALPGDRVADGLTWSLLAYPWLAN